MVLQGHGPMTGFDGCWYRRIVLGWGLGDEFREVTIAEERNEGDETNGDGDEDNVPAGSGRAERAVHADARIGSSEEIREEMEGEGAEGSTGGGEDGGPEEFTEEFFAFPLTGGTGGGDGAKFGRGMLGELWGKSAGNGRRFPPGL